METAEIMIQCAFAWRECPDCDGFGTIPTQMGHVGCPRCEDHTGKQYALPDNVRVRCQRCLGRDVEHLKRFGYGTCVPDKQDSRGCRGLGSKPTTDGWVWLEAWGVSVQFYPPTPDLGKTWANWRCCVGVAEADGQDSKEAFFEALSKTLVAGRYTLGVVGGG